MGWGREGCREERSIHLRDDDGRKHFTVHIHAAVTYTVSGSSAVSHHFTFAAMIHFRSSVTHGRVKKDFYIFLFVSTLLRRAMDTKYDQAFLLDQIASILQFYAPVVADDTFGGYNNQLRDDGTV